MSDISPVYGVTDWGSILSSLPSAMSNIRSQTAQQVDTMANVPVQQAQAANLQQVQQLTAQDVQAKSLANQFAQFRLQQLQGQQMPMPDANGNAPIPGTGAGTPASGSTPVGGGAPAPSTASSAGGAAKGPPMDSGATNPFDPDAESAKMDQLVNQLRVNKSQTPYEQAYYTAAQAKDTQYAQAGLPSVDFAGKAKAMYEQRVANETNQKQLAAQKMADAAYSIADAPAGAAFNQLNRLNPDQAAKLKAVADQNGWTAQDLDDHARQYAEMLNNKLFQVTGDTLVDKNGVNVNSRTGLKPLGEQTQTLSPNQVAEVKEKGLEPTKVPYGLSETTVPAYKASGQQGLAGYTAAVTGTPQPGAAPATGSPPAQPGAAAPVSAPAAVGAPGSKATSQAPTLPGVDIDAIPKLNQGPAPTAGTGGQPFDKSMQEGNAAQVLKAKSEYAAQLVQASKNNAVYTQLSQQLATANPRYYGPSSTTATALANFVTYLKGKAPNDLITQTEVDKYLTQQGVLGAKNLLGAGQQLRQQELLLLISQANPNVHQPLDAIKNLVAFGKANNDYDAQSAATGLAALRKGADPNAIPVALNAPGNTRSDFVQGRMTQRGVDMSAGTGQSATTPVKLSGTGAAAQYAALPSGAHYIDPNGQQRTKP